MPSDSRHDGDVLAAEVLYTRGVEALEHGRLATAGRTLRLALERTDDPQVRTRVLLSLAYQQAEQGRLSDGLAALDRAEGTGLPRNLRALLASQRGLLLMRSGDSDGALAAFTRALDGLGDDPAAVARAAVNRGNVYLQRHDLRRARADFERCVDVAGSHDMPLLAAKALHNLGFVELLAGNLPRAVRVMAEARTGLADTAAAVVAVCEADRAQVLLAAGLTSDAETTLASAAAAFGRQGLRQSQAEAELAQARLALFTGRPSDAARLGRRAGTRFRRRGSGSWGLRADAVVVAAHVEANRELPGVLRTAPALANALDAAGLRDEARVVRLQLARAQLARRRVHAAARLGQRVRTPHTAPITTRLLDRGVRADIAVARGRASRAAQHLRRGLTELFAWQSSFGSLDLQTGVAAHGRALAVRGLQLAVEDGRPAVVYDWSERARAFASRVPAVRPPADAGAASTLQQLRALQAQAAASDMPDTDRSRMAELEQQVRDVALYPAGPGIVTEPLALEELRTMLAADGGTLVSHLVVDGQLHALTVTADTERVQALGPYEAVGQLLSRAHADLDAAASRLSGPIRAAVGLSLHGAAAELGRLLLDALPVAAGPVLLVPSAALAGVPWTLLPSLSGVPVTVARTATAWALTRQPAEPITRVGLVAGPGVDRAEEEVRRAAAAWSAPDAVYGADATAAAVTGLASGVDLLHVAAHGTHSVDNPLFSGLQLVDGPWFGHDIATVDPVPAHVVLSACELGKSSVRAGEETIGMTAAWQHAGTRTVVASPVRVNDDTACEVLAAHHAGLAAGHSPSVALAGAIKAVPSDAAPAPFVCFGAGW